MNRVKGRSEGGKGNKNRLEKGGEKKQTKKEGERVIIGLRTGLIESCPAASQPVGYDWRLPTALFGGSGFFAKT